MKKSQIKDEHYKLIESIVKDCPLYEGHEELIDDFIETIYKKSYLLIDSIHDMDRLKKHLISICDESIEQVLKDVKAKAEEPFEDDESDDSDFFQQTRSIVFENQNDDDTINQLEDPIEKYPCEKTDKETVEKLINAVRIADSKYPDKEFYKFFTMRYIKKYDFAEIARTMNLSPAELSKRFTELINAAKEYV